MAIFPCCSDFWILPRSHRQYSEIPHKKKSNNKTKNTTCPVFPNRSCYGIAHGKFHYQLVLKSFKQKISFLSILQSQSLLLMSQSIILLTSLAMSKTHQKLKAFTLIEILITIVILAILAGLTIIALNPGQNIDDANDVRRKTDVNTLLSAIWQYNVDNNGSFPSDITSTAQAISNSAADICTDLVPTYMAAIPADPTTGSYTDCTTYASGYTVSTANNHVTVSATLSDSSAYSQTR